MKKLIALGIIAVLALPSNAYANFGFGGPTFSVETVVADTVGVDTDNFDNNLSILDDDVQKALDTIDDLSLSGIPGGSDTEVQFNDAGSFGGDAELVYNKTTDVLTAGEFVETVGSVGASIGNTVIRELLIYTPSADTSITAGGGITVTHSVMRVQGDGGAVDITANPQITAATGEVTVVIIQGLSDTNTVTIEDGTGVALCGGVTAVLGKNDNISLMYDTGETEWLEFGGRCDLN